VCEILLASLEDRLQGILVFGSLARGTAKYNAQHQSDIDLLVIVDDLPENPFARAKLEWEILGIVGLGVHCIWETPQELKELVNAHQAFTFEILRDGQAVFDPQQIFVGLKKTVQELILQLGIKETKYGWIWPQKIPGSLIEW
jgi:predicted nucleotidyltransferase